MKTKGKRLEGIAFTNADPRYAGKLDDPQGGDTTMLMQQVREVMTVNHGGYVRILAESLLCTLGRTPW